MDTPEKRRLLKIYDEKREIYSEIAAKRNRGECTHLELKEAEQEMEVIGEMLIAMERSS